MDSLIGRCAVAGLLAVAAAAALGQVVPKLPTIEEGQEARENCLGLMAVLPVMKHPRMQELAESPALYKSGGNALAINAVASLAREGNADALFTLGMMFESDYCFRAKRDLQTSQLLYREAAARGSAEAKARVRP
jgi:TPR repeat protein